jgi:hypothetical protein
VQRPSERDEAEAFEESVADLVRLDRYEQRARSQLKRALNAFMAIKLMYRLAVPNAGA